MPDTTQPDPESSTPAADVDNEHHPSADTTAQRSMPAQSEPAERAEPTEPDSTEPDAARPPVRAVAGLAELTREPQPLVWADTGRPVSAAVQLISPYERRVSRTERGEMVTGVRVSCTDGYGRQVHVDLAAAQTRMASVWDDRDTTPVALLQLVPEPSPELNGDQSRTGSKPSSTPGRVSTRGQWWSRPTRSTTSTPRRSPLIATRTWRPRWSRSPGCSTRDGTPGSAGGG